MLFTSLILPEEVFFGEIPVVVHSKDFWLFLLLKIRLLKNCYGYTFKKTKVCP